MKHLYGNLADLIPVQKQTADSNRVNIKVAGFSIAFNAKRCVKDYADIVVEGKNLIEIMNPIISLKEKLSLS